MTEPRHLRTVPPSPSPSSSSDQLLDEQAARAVHRKVADQLSVLSDAALVQRARQVAQDFKEPSRHHGLTQAEWCCLMVRMVGDVADQVAGITLIGGPRPARQARGAIERTMGLLLVLDDSLRGLEDGEAS
jgi:hypothetical protein